MSVPLRFGSLSLSRVAARPLPFRSFSTTPTALRAKGAIIREKQTAPKPTPRAKTDPSAQPGEQPPTNTEAPFTSRQPAPDNAPASSAEVPPNASMPPPPPKPDAPAETPPPPPMQTMEELMASISSKPEAEVRPLKGPGSAKAKAGQRYDAGSNRRPINLEAIISKSYDSYQINHSDPRIHDPTLLPSVRTAPVTGRTIFIDTSPGRSGKANNPEGAFKKLEVVVGQNKIKQQFHQQKFRERPGMKKKRLRMTRWRRRFRFGFIETARRVKDLKKQGW